MNIVDYIRYRGDLSFKSDPFNEVDNLVFSQLIYADLEYVLDRDDRMTITSRSEEGTVREELFIELEGEELKIGFNAKFILDALKAVDEEEILLDMNTAVSPCLIKPVEGDAYEYLILPVRISTN